MLRVLVSVIAVSVSSPVIAEVNWPAGEDLQMETAAVPDTAARHRYLSFRRNTPSGNAATHYYRAFAGLSAAEPDVISRFHDQPVLDDDGRERFPHIEWLATPLQDLPREDLASDLAEFELILRDVELGARRRECRWQVEWRQDGLLLTLPELSMFRSLGRILSLRTRLLVAEGEFDGAIESMQTSFGLARHLCHGPTLDHVLVGIGVANTTLDGVEEMMQRAGSPNLYWALASMPTPFCNIQLAVEQNRDVLTQMFPILNDFERGPVDRETIVRLERNIQSWIEDVEGEGGQVLKTLAQVSLYSRAQAGLLSAGITKAVVDRMPRGQVVVLHVLNEYRAAHDAMSKWLHLPYHQAVPHVRKAFPEFQRASVQIDAVLTGGLLTELDFGQGFVEVWSSATKLDRRIAALITIEAIRDCAARTSNQIPQVLASKETLPIPIDPVTGRPFLFNASGSRFQLRTVDKAFSLSCELTASAE